jgi:D-alanyl-D-alanine carboxypeptidase
MLCRPKKLFMITFLLCAIAVASGCNGSASTAESLQASLDATWNQYRQAHGLPGGGSAVYIETPSGIYYASSGMAAGVDQNTRFRIASNTKTFTAAAIMLLDQQGRLRIDDTIVSDIPGQPGVPYVPNTPQYAIPNKASITIRQLLSHTAGVFDVDNEMIPATCPAPYAGKHYPTYIMETDPYHQFSPDELVAVNATCQLDFFAPGTDYHYSDTGYSILAAIIERASGMPYDQFLVQNLIAPNGLSSTSVVMLGTDQTIPLPFNHGYIYDQATLTDTTEDNMSLHIGEGNITSTPADIARWVRRLIRGEAGPNAAAVNAMTTPTPQSIHRGKNYGLSVQYFSGLGYGHTGANQGYLSLMMHDPVADVTTIVYFNVWDLAYLLTDQFALLKQAGLDARMIVGY